MSKIVPVGFELDSLLVRLMGWTRVTPEDPRHNPALEALLNAADRTLYTVVDETDWAALYRPDGSLERREEHRVQSVNRRRTYDPREPFRSPQWEAWSPSRNLAHAFEVIDHLGLRYGLVATESGKEWRILATLGRPALGVYLNRQRGVAGTGETREEALASALGEAICEGLLEIPHEEPCVA